MFVYAFAKGARLGYLPASYGRIAQKGYRGILKEFVKTDANGQLNLEGIVSVAGLGGNLSEKVVTNDPTGIGALLLAAVEMETAAKGQKRLSYQLRRNERNKRQHLQGHRRAIERWRAFSFDHESAGPAAWLQHTDGRERADPRTQRWPPHGKLPGEVSFRRQPIAGTPPLGRSLQRRRGFNPDLRIDSRPSHPEV
jgi:hypothetical protein